MKTVKFNKLSITNFMSVGMDTIEVEFTPGVHFITGFNKDTNGYNGVGKTTIINAFYFALFGKLYGDNSGKLKIADIQNNINRGTASVTLSFDVDGDTYQIERMVSPSKCILKKNGSEENQKSSIAETNETICKLIQADSEVYSTTDIMDSDTKSFLLKEPAKKIKFIENVMGLGIFSDMLKDVKSDLTKTNKELAISETRLNETKRFLESEKIRKIKWDEDQLIKTRLVMEEISKKEEFISDLENSSVEDQTENIKNVENLLEDLQHKKNVKAPKASQFYNESRIHLENELKTLKGSLLSEDSLICKECKRPFDEHSEDFLTSHNIPIIEKIEVTKTELKKVLDKLSKCREFVSKLGESITKQNGLLSQYKTLQKEFEEADIKLSSYKRDIETLNDRILDISNEINPFKLGIEDLNTKLDQYQIEVDKWVEEAKILNYMKYLCSPEGVKSHIISKILDLFNAKLNFYLNELSAPFKIEFDEFFEAKILNANGREVSYHSLSGGERKRVDLSLLFAFKDIRRMQSSVNINVTMLDELLDSALCENGIEDALNIFKSHSDEYGESVFIITHRMDHLDTTDTKVIYLEKENDITKRVDSIEA